MKTAPSPPRHLIIGSSGLLGRALRAHLLAAGVDLTVADRHPAPCGTLKTCSLERLGSLGTDFDAVYLLAACIPWGNFNQPSPELIRANVTLPAQVAELFPKAHLLFASSVSVYGFPRELPITLAHPYQRPNFYAQTKLAGETVLQAHPCWSILRLSSLYGEAMPTHSFLPAIINQALQTGRIRLLGSGERRQNYLAAERAGAMFARAAFERHCGIHHAVASASFSNLQVAQMVAAHLGGVHIEHFDQDDSPSFVYQASDALEPTPPDEAKALREGIARVVTSLRSSLL